MNYWQVDVKIEFEGDNGRIQKVTEKYLVDAVSATDAETKVYKEFDGGLSFEVIKIIKTKIVKVIEK